MSLQIQWMGCWFISDYLAYFTGGSNLTPDGLGKLTVGLNGTGSVTARVMGNEPTPKSMRSDICHDMSVEDWGGANGSKCRLFVLSGYSIYAVKVDATGYKLEIQRNSPAGIVGAGSTKLSWGHSNKYDWRLMRDGVRHTFDYGVAGSLNQELQYADTVVGVSIGVPWTDNVSASATMEIGALATCTGDSHSDRPDTQETVKRMAVASGTPHHSEFSDHNYLDVDDLSGGGSPDGDSTYDVNTGAASSTEKNSYPTTNVTLSNIRAVAIYYNARSTAADKTLKARLFTCDGSVEEFSGQSTIVGESYGWPSPAIFNLAPDGSSWDQTDDLDKLELGIESETGADSVSLRLTAIQGAALGVALDAYTPPAAGDRRRVPAQHI